MELKEKTYEEAFPILEYAYFGELYKTRDGRKVVYLGGNACWIEGEEDYDSNDAAGKWILSEEENRRDIVSKWED